jgi:HEPN domain-containing protein
MSNADDPLDWVKYAEQDWQIAISTVRRKKPMTIPTCFHAQQCAEKYLKSILIARKIDFPKTHDLSTLNSLCEKAGILTGFSIQSLTVLSDHAVVSRYPGTEPSLDDAREAIEIAKTIRKFARKWLGVK